MTVGVVFASGHQEAALGRCRSHLSIRVGGGSKPPPEPLLSLAHDHRCGVVTGHSFGLFRPWSHRATTTNTTAATFPKRFRIQQNTTQVATQVHFNPISYLDSRILTLAGSPVDRGTKSSFSQNLEETSRLEELASALRAGINSLGSRAASVHSLRSKEPLMWRRKHENTKTRYKNDTPHPVLTCYRPRIGPRLFTLPTFFIGWSFKI